MKTLLPWRLPLGWTLLAIFFYPLLILFSWGLASFLDVPVEFPGLWGTPLAKTLPLYALSFAVTALAQGGKRRTWLAGCDAAGTAEVFQSAGIGFDCGAFLVALASATLPERVLYGRSAGRHVGAAVFSASCWRFFWPGFISAAAETCS